MSNDPENNRDLAMSTIKPMNPFAVLSEDENAQDVPAQTSEPAQKTTMTEAAAERPTCSVPATAATRGQTTGSPSLIQMIPLAKTSHEVSSPTSTTNDLERYETQAQSQHPQCLPPPLPPTATTAKQQPPTKQQTPAPPNHGTRRSCWTSQEDLKLRELVADHGPGDWVFVASHLPNRTNNQCRARWISISSPDNNKKPLTDREYQTIIQLQDSFGDKWTKISKYLDSGRTVQFVRGNWRTFIRPNIVAHLAQLRGVAEAEIVQDKDGHFGYRPNERDSTIAYVTDHAREHRHRQEPLTDHEYQTIIQLQDSFGNKWGRISKHLDSSRTAPFVQNRWRQFILPLIIAHLAQMRGVAEAEIVQDKNGCFDYHLNERDSAIACVIIHARYIRHSQALTSQETKPESPKPVVTKKRTKGQSRKKGAHKKSKKEPNKLVPVITPKPSEVESSPGMDEATLKRHKRLFTKEERRLIVEKPGLIGERWTDIASRLYGKFP